MAKRQRDRETESDRETERQRGMETERQSETEREKKKQEKGNPGSERILEASRKRPSKLWATALRECK